jgi:hydroxymethylbilane synthase
MKSLIIGTRGSSLALWQANHVKSLIEMKTKTQCEIKVISTRGDEDQSTPLPEVGDKGFFTAEIEAELLTGTIDLAVHSMKDLPVDLGSDFRIAAVPKRFSHYDVMVTRTPMDFEDLPKNAIIATGSLRRELQIKSIQPNIKIVDVRGNIDTRIKKLKDNHWDGLIMAEAAIKRLDLDVYYYKFSSDEMTPAAGQGAVAIQVNKTRNDLDQILSKINHNPSSTAIEIERQIINKLEGGCKTPTGCLVSIKKNNIKIDAYLSDITGTQVIRISDSGELIDKDNIINNIITAFMDEGAQDIISANRKVFVNA